MSILQETLDICKRENIKPARSKGQNFLINEDVYEAIIESSELTKDDIVLEVGPGLGYLTRKLAGKVDGLIAVELDDKLAELLKNSLNKEGIDNIEVLNENILDFDLSVIPDSFRDLVGVNQDEIPERVRDDSVGHRDDNKYKIVANLPYNISSVFLRRFLTIENKPEMMVLMLQKEVAKRIVAKPGKMSVLAVSVQYYADVEIVRQVPKEDFWPSPKVDSAIVKIVPFGGLKRDCHPRSESRTGSVSIPRNDREDRDFFRLVKHGFSSKRKKLKNNLAGGYRISQKEAEEKIKNAGFSENARAQELSVNNWKKLLKEF